MVVTRECLPDPTQTSAEPSTEPPQELPKVKGARDLYDKIIDAYEKHDHDMFKQLVTSFFETHPVVNYSPSTHEAALSVSDEVSTYHTEIVDLSIKIHSLLAQEAAYPTQGSLTTDPNQLEKAFFHLDTALRLGALATHSQTGWLNHDHLLAVLQKAYGYGPLVESAREAEADRAAAYAARLAADQENDLWPPKTLLKY